MKTKSSLLEKFIIFIICLPLMGALFLWYGHVFLVTNLPYWKWVAIAFVTLIVTQLLLQETILRRISNIFFTLLLATALISQVLAWLDIIKLPLLK